ncbi:MAG: 1-acyl-sn-glycerol-3-phosphate acyltransferase, partial [Lentisphaeria bacterium]|nr:1-acyl-sn-glycerol-3-phosphate acyltransferase [Lentisphaeria bacterium]
LIPLALKTDFWGNGKIIKDLGKISPAKTVHFEFSEPVIVENTKVEHQKVIDFIQNCLKKWNAST